MPFILPVTNKVDNNITTCVLLYFFEPVSHIDKSIFPRNIIGKEYTVSSSIENPCNRSKGFLSSCVPDLQFYDIVFQFASKWTELDSYRHLMLQLKVIIHYSC